MQTIGLDKNKLEQYCCEKYLINRPRILVKNTEQHLQYLVAVIVAFNSNLIHVRYFDNPLSTDSIWLYGGEAPGLDKDKYKHSTFRPHVAEGYDEIIDLSVTKIYTIPDAYPYYTGRYGNCFTIPYFLDLYKQHKVFITQNENKVPEKIEESIGKKLIRRRITHIKNLTNLKLSEQDCQKILSYKLNKSMRKKIMRKLNISEKFLEGIKHLDFELKLNCSSIDLYINIIGWLLSIHYVVFFLDEYKPKMKTLGIVSNDCKETIYLYKTNDSMYRLEDAIKDEN